MSVLTQEEGEDLLKLVRYALLASQGKLSFFPSIKSSPNLKEHKGVFVGFRKNGLLRGCIGSLNPGKPLEESVIDMTLNSALKDARFAPLSPEEIPELTLEISILSPPIVTSPQNIQIGVHGVMVIDGDLIGLLLPFVAKEHGWDVPTLLSQACLKGGLPPNSWQQGASIASFTTQVFQGPAS